MKQGCGFIGFNGDKFWGGYCKNFAILLANIREEVEVKSTFHMSLRSINRVGLNSDVQRACETAAISNCRDLFSHTSLDLVHLLDLSLHTVNEIFASVSSSVKPESHNAWDLIQLTSKKQRRIPTGIAPIDSSFNGGLPIGIITEILGAAGTGKTQCCISIAARALLSAGPRHAGVGVIFIDTEMRFSPTRLREVILGIAPRLTPAQLISTISSCLVMNVKTLAELNDSLKDIEDLIAEKHIGLIIIDSVASLVRGTGAQANIQQRQMQLNMCSAALKRMSHNYGVAVLVSNQVMSSKGDASDDGSANFNVGAALGLVWAHAVNTRLVLERARVGDSEFRTMTIAKSSVCPVRSFAVSIGTDGVTHEVGAADIIQHQNFWRPAGGMGGAYD
jgi:RecA/RadA recombinase